jgi:hypothetical protein
MPEQDISKLLTAAVINERFRVKFLSSRKSALRDGFEGEAFRFTEEEKEQILGISANSLAEFARKLNDIRRTPEK